MEPEEIQTQPIPPEVVLEPENIPVQAANAVLVVHDASWNSDWFGIFQWLAGVIVIATFVMTFVVQAFEIPSESMEQTLLIGDYLLVNKVQYGKGGIWRGILPYSQVKRGDIIVFRYPIHPQQHFVKRVIGIPGDRIKIINKQVLINGQKTDERAYALFKSRYFDPFRDNFPSGEYSGNADLQWWSEMQKLMKDDELTVPPNQYFVLGDNRDESLDSRYWGFVPAENIVGRPLMIYWSMNPETADEDLEKGRNAKLSRLLSGILNIPKEARWNRTLRLVH